MLKVLPYPGEEAEIRLASILSRRSDPDPALVDQVRKIMENVRQNGDKALIEYTRKFDAPDFHAGQLTVSEAEIDAAYDAIDPEVLHILRRAMANIEAFHRHQLRSSYFINRPDGTFLGQRVTPVPSAGLYIPGGRAGETPLVSSILMNGIPARIAGVQDIALVTPPRKDGTVNHHILVAAKEVGINRIHRVGSAWAIAALAYGTSSVGRTDVIVGPGNIFVTLAKKLLSGFVGIDLLAGPSEILIIADSEAKASFIAADLLSQAEHDSMASAVLITTETKIAEKTLDELREQLVRLPRREIAEASLEAYGAVFLVKSMQDAINLANRLAPEHLELHLREPWKWVGGLSYAGAIFLGENSPEAVGDYFAGPNHVLPTAGTARFASALGVENFLRRTSLVSYSRAALERDASAIIRLAEIEGLEAHASSIRIRSKMIS